MSGQPGMQYLERISQCDQATWYRLCGEPRVSISRWVASTPETVQICNTPELLGVEFSRALRRGLTEALCRAPFRDWLQAVPPGRLCVMNFLRGGLNFDLRNVLHDALGANLHSTCFMSSQRSRQDGRWQVQEDMYRKIRVPEGAIVLIGDVVATGVTADNGLEVLAEHLEQQGTAIAGVVLFTLGCHKSEKILERHHHRFAERFPGYQETHVVYLEGKFRLVDSSTNLRIGTPGTDLIKPGAVLAPEIVRAQYDSLGAPLERCIIYDAGSRAFDGSVYLADVTDYWEQVQLLAREGFTLLEALQERWPATEFSGEEALLAAGRQRWHGVPDEELLALWELHAARWTSSFRAEASRPGALERVCESRLETLMSLSRHFKG